ncbi:hypothetical protein MIND_00021700 [Mycena indigotica]|uniref:Glyoxal oxidase n=1 Tax=Mycena indigotica TaxID=2126181 RepID=A0A8H6TCQ8_9AGAR|nr:uncharacterized protein MIND_00021700 [Mycena indigotica]KAF7315075.1 hypothetical protein MIND_00021700 [Mycena indigotica]
MLLAFALSCLAILNSTTAKRVIQWSFVQNGTSGIIPVELITISPTLMLMYDRADGNPLLLPNGQRAWAALWNIETQTATPLLTQTDAFCAGGAFISNGTLVSVGGQPHDSGASPGDGLMGIRLFGPCASSTGAGCTVFEDQANIHLKALRWYPTGLRLPDGSVMIIGGSNANTFYNNATTAVNSIEFFPSKEDTVRPSQFLLDAQPVNMFPRSVVLPSGHVFIAANNISMLYDVDSNTELARLPEIPNGVRITNPFDGSLELLPLIPPLYEPTVLVCGGSAADDRRPTSNLTNLDPTTNQCSRMTLTPAGIARGWQVELMPDRRILAESVLLPNGDVIFINGGHTGYSGYPSVSNSNVTGSNAANPAMRPILYRTSLSRNRITQDGLPSSNIPRMYHSVASMTGKGNIMVAGSNPNRLVTPPGTVAFPTEYRVEYLNPDFITNNSPRPVIHRAPTQLLFNQRVTMKVTIPPSLWLGTIRVSLMDLGYVTHAQHANSRLVVLEHTLVGNTLIITGPPNANIFPPAPAWLFLVADGVWSEGLQLMVGDGGNPPRPASAQGIKIPTNSI